MAVRNRIAELITEKAKRDKRKLSAAEVAREMKMTRQNMSKWVNNEIKNYDSDTLTDFCHYFGCTVGDILIRIDEPQPAPEDTPKE